MKHLLRIAIGLGGFALAIALLFGIIWLCQALDPFVPDLPSGWGVWIGGIFIGALILYNAWDMGKEFIE